MAPKTIYFVLLVIAFSLVVENAEAGWKFWKKKKDDTTSTTIAPGVSGDPLAAASDPQNAGKNSGDVKPSVAGNSPAIGNNKTPSPSSTGDANSRGSTSGLPSTGTRGAIAGAANPGLAIGVANSGPNIRNNAQPQRPNPGTEVGLDISPSRPSAKPGTGGTSGQGYRDWAVDLTGAGDDTRQGPKVPSRGPALTGSGGQQPAGGVRPGSPVISPGGQPSNVNNRQSPPAVGPRPGSPSSLQPGTLPAGQSSGQGSKPVAVATPINPNPQPSGTSGGSQVSTLHVGSLKPGQSRPGSPSSGYGSPGSPTSGGSPTPGGTSSTSGKSWAEIAGNGGNGRPSSPTPAPRPGSVQPGQSLRPGQIPAGGRPTTVGGLTGQSSTTGTGPGLRNGAAASATGAGGTGAGKQTYSSNPMYSKGNGVTDEDLVKLAEALFIKDTNNANKYITLNLQKQTTGSNTADQAPQPLLTIDPRALQIPTIDKVIKIYDNYKLDSSEREYISPAQRTEESLLVDTFLSTNVMSAAMRFLADKNFIRKDYYDYKDTLRRLWFNLYSRGGDGKIGSAGFEHVFLTELKLGTEVSGLHNWIYFNAEEVAKRADYLGYIKKVDLGDKAAIVKIHAKHSNIDKPVTTMFIGTSPELEMALYTVCFLTRKDRPCPVSLGGTKFNIVTHKIRYRGNDLIGSAYPDI